MTFAAFMFIGGALIVGFLFGGWLTDQKWERNADVPYLLESNGSLYKVTKEQ